MNSRFSPLALLLVILLAGCQTTGGADGSSAAPKTDKQKLAEADAGASVCSAMALGSPAGSVVSQQVIFLTQDASANDKLLKSTSRLTGQQKIALRTYLAENLKCRETFFAGLEGTRYYEIFARYFNTMDEVYAKLLSDQITIGEANAAKLKAIRDNTAAIAR